MRGFAQVADKSCSQVLDILARLSIAERASIDECYLDITQEASRRLAACSGHPPLPIKPEQVHVCGEVAFSPFPRLYVEAHSQQTCPRMNTGQCRRW